MKQQNPNSGGLTLAVVIAGAMGLSAVAISMVVGGLGLTASVAIGIVVALLAFIVLVFAFSPSADTTAAKAAVAPAPAAVPKPAPAPEPAPEPAAKPDPVAEAVADATRPAALDGPRDGQADDLKQIKGVGPKMEKLLNSLGFYHFDQVAAWTGAEVAWVDDNLEGFKGRVSRDNWVEQAQLLAAGGETEFSKKVGDGDVY